VLRRLVRAAADWLKPQTDCAYSVVMDGTKVVPTEYTGRVGIPEFKELGKVVVLRLIHDGFSRPDWKETYGVTCEHGARSFRELSLGRFANLGGSPALRSDMKAECLGYPFDLASGRLEDTRAAKRLITDDGLELRSAHVSSFAFRNQGGGSE